MITNKDIRVENNKLILNGTPHEIGADTSEIEAEVDALSETVGDSTAGLVKDVADLEGSIEGLNIEWTEIFSKDNVGASAYEYFNNLQYDGKNIFAADTKVHELMVALIPNNANVYTAPPIIAPMSVWSQKMPLGVRGYNGDVEYITGRDGDYEARMLIYIKASTSFTVKIFAR